jgi:hypothetical protein
MRMVTLRLVLLGTVICGAAVARAQVSPNQVEGGGALGAGTAPTQSSVAVPGTAAPGPAADGYPETWAYQDPSGAGTPGVAFGAITPLAGRHLLLRRGKGEVQAFVKVNMSKSEVGKPTTITPDVYFGVSDFLQLGVVHSSPLGWQMPAGMPSSICVTGKDDGCPKLYNNLGIDALSLAVPGPIEVAGHVRFNFDSIDPLRINLLVGFVAKLHLRWFAFLFYPSLQIGLNKREQLGGPTLDGNKEVLYLPGELEFQVTPFLALLAQAAFYTEARNFSDTYRIPLGAAALFTISPMLDVGVRWAWDNVGKVSEGANRADHRSLVALADFHF